MCSFIYHPTLASHPPVYVTVRYVLYYGVRLTLYTALGKRATASYLLALPRPLLSLTPFQNARACMGCGGGCWLQRSTAAHLTVNTPLIISLPRPRP